MKKFDVAVIGGGILGTTISFWISTLYDLKICLIEKESKVAQHASSRNTGVVHSPFYLNPSSKKVLAKSALISYDMWKNLSKDRKLPQKKTGVLELALNENQHKSLQEYMKWGEKNGIPSKDLELLDGKQVSKKEPNVKCHSAIECKREASVDFGLFTKEIKKESEKNGTKFLMSNNLKSIETADSTTLYLEDFKISSKFVINCA